MRPSHTHGTPPPHAIHAQGSVGASSSPLQPETTCAPISSSTATGRRTSRAPRDAAWWRHSRQLGRAPTSQAAMAERASWRTTCTKVESLSFTSASSLEPGVLVQTPHGANLKWEHIIEADVTMRRGRVHPQRTNITCRMTCGFTLANEDRGVFSTATPVVLG
jgi:hypothetical protein